VSEEKTPVVLSFDHRDLTTFGSARYSLD
jgi:hypothetical protein